MKILIVASKSRSLINFRGPLLRKLRTLGHEVIALAPDPQDSVRDTLESWEVEYHNYYLERTGVSFLRDFKSYYSLKKKIRSLKPDLVLSYTIKPVIYGSMAARAVGVNRIFAMVTGLGSAFDNKANFKSRCLSFITKRLYKKAINNIDGVIFQNPDDQKAFIQKKIVPPRKTHRVYGSGIDLDYYTQARVVTEPLRFLFIGRLLKEKGVLDFIGAATKIRKKYPAVEFHLAGGVDSNPSAIKKTELDQWKKAGLIHYHGDVNDIREVIGISSVFVLPSYREGTPRTALESMAMGRPLIMADSPGCRETVAEGENGFLVPVKDPTTLAGAMEKFIKNPGLIVPMGKRSREIAEEKYDVRKVNRDIIRILGV